MSWTGVFLTLLLGFIVMGNVINTVLSMYDEELDRLIQTTVENDFAKTVNITE